MIKRIIGIDSGSYYTGYGIVEIIDSKIVYLDSGCIKVRSSIFFDRLKIIYFRLLDILINFKPVDLVIEKTFVYRNYSSIIRLNQINGVVILAALVNFISIFEYSVTKIRKFVVNKGNVSKKYINKSICKLFNLNKLNFNVTDALASAVAHSNYFYKLNKF